MKKRVVKRIILYVSGLWFLALGVSFSIKADLGVSPVNSLPYIISEISKISMGTCIIIVFGFFMVLQMVILRKEYKWKDLLQIVFSTIFGYFVNVTNLLTKGITAASYPIQLLLLVISIIMIGAGIAMYVDADLVPMPMEGLVIAISKKTEKLKFHQIKIILDSLEVAVGIALSLIVLGRLIGIREGTIITAVFAGKLVSVFQSKIKPAVTNAFSGFLSRLNNQKI
jgi:uncharacterized membrane protein YczE